MSIRESDRCDMGGKEGLVISWSPGVDIKGNRHTIVNIQLVEVFELGVAERFIEAMCPMSER